MGFHAFLLWFAEPYDAEPGPWPMIEWALETGPIPIFGDDAPVTRVEF
jgi:hypothetical protein